MSAHTPGPWEARRIDSQEWEIDAPNGDPTIGYSSWTGMISVYGCNDFPNAGEVVAKANARLIAAAPELLAALRECADRLAIHMTHTEDLVAHMTACAAIAKAEGRE